MKITWCAMFVMVVFLAGVPMSGQADQQKLTDSDKRALTSPSKPRPDDSTLKPGEIVPKETPVSQPKKPKGNGYIR